MGLLDDAIREHLDLKRRRGADPGEIEQAEREALGPVRRNSPAGDETAAELEPVTDGDVLYEDEPDDWGDEVPEAPAAGPRAPGYDDELDDPGAPARWEEEDPFKAGDAPPPAPAPGQPRDPLAHGLEEETAEYDVAGTDDPDAEDVLEETPEFLQDTPDHDRLWFEQRPPRDFDFDG